MQKQKHTHNRRYLSIVVIIVAVCLIAILFAFVRHYLLTVNNYFINIDDAGEVRNIVASEFTIGETTKTEAENSLTDRIFGNLDCNYYWSEIISTIDSRIICEALGSYRILFPKYYRIYLDFYENVLTEIKIEIFNPNAL